MDYAVSIIHLRCGRIRAPARFMELGGEGELDFPVWAFLIRHPSRGEALFDAGMHPADHGRTVSKHYHFHVPPEQTVTGQLGLHGLAARDVRTVVISHIHSDHCGGVELLPNARLVVNRAEAAYAQAHSPTWRYFDHGHDRLLIDGDHDLFGDGSVEVLATPGHTCGHQSLRVRRFGGADVLAGDACYFCRSLARDEFDQPPAADPELYLATKRRLMAMQAAGDFIVPGHDDFLHLVPPESLIAPIDAPA